MSVTETPSSVLPAWLRAMRPRQWVKNVLVLAPVFPAGSQVGLHTFTGVGVAFVLFCLVSSAVYLINDAKDVEADRAHPTKRYRPIAAGVVPVNLAYVLAIVLGAGAIGISLLANPQLAIVIAAALVFAASFFAVWDVYQLIPMLMALGIATVGCLVSELKLANSGLGFEAIQAYNHFQVPAMYAVILVIFALVAAGNAGLAALSRLVAPVRGRQ